MRFYRTILFLLICFLTNLPVIGQELALDARFNPTQIQKTKLLSSSPKNKTISFASRLNLFVLLSPECPLCKNYSIVLNKIQKEFKNDLSTYGVVPGQAYSKKDISHFTKEYKINFPIYIDKNKELTSYLKGTVTPEVILLNKEGELIYRGAIDDWVSELGKKKLVVSNEYLKTAITQYLQHQTVSIKNIEPKGCLINEF